MTRKQRRGVLIGGCLGPAGVAVGLVLFALRTRSSSSIRRATSPRSRSQPGQRFRLGGLVEPGQRQARRGQPVHFAVTDTRRTIPVTYTGVLPDLFREGQGVVAEGTLEADGLFHGRQRARQARRELHAAGSGRRRCKAKGL